MTGAVTSWPPPLPGARTGPGAPSAPDGGRRRRGHRRDRPPLCVDAPGDSAGFATAILEGSPDLVVVLGDGGRIHWASPAATAMLGRPSAWLAGQPLGGIVHPEDRPKLVRAVEAARGPDAGPAAVELRLSHVDGHWIDTEATVTDYSANPRVGGAVLTIRDATEQRQVEHELRRMALHDSLTGLANRALFRDHAQHALPTAG